MYKNYISIAYSTLDILFPNELVEASIYAGAQGTDFHLHAVEYKGGKAMPVLVDSIIHPLLSCSNEGAAYTALLFSKELFSNDVAKKYGKLTKKSKNSYFAFLTTAETRVVQLKASEFSLMAGTIGLSLRQKGLSAIRFQNTGRIQFLTDFNKLLEALLESKYD